METKPNSSDKLIREYDSNFQVTPEYRKSLPDVQNSGPAELDGARVPILQVGISGFRLPLNYVGPDGENLNIETAVTGTVSLDADKRVSICLVLSESFTNIKTRHFLLKFLPKF